MKKSPFTRLIDDDLYFGCDVNGQPCLFLASNEGTRGAEDLLLSIEPFCAFLDNGYGLVEEGGIRIARSSSLTYTADVTITSVGDGQRIKRNYGLEVFQRISDAAADLELAAAVFLTLGIQENDRLYERIDETLETT